MAGSQGRLPEEAPFELKSDVWVEVSWTRRSTKDRRERVVQVQGSAHTVAEWVSARHVKKEKEDKG